MKKILCAFGGGLFFGGVGVYAYIRHKYMLLRRFCRKCKRFNLNIPSRKDEWEFPED